MYLNNYLFKGGRKKVISLRYLEKKSFFAPFFKFENFTKGFLDNNFVVLSPKTPVLKKKKLLAHTAPPSCYLTYCI